MHVGSAITGDACAASVSGHSGASSGSGATYKTTIPPDFWESKWYIEASIRGFSVRHCEMSCTKASGGRRRDSQVRAMQVGSAITGDACAASVAGHSGASSGSGTTYKTTIPPDFWETKWCHGDSMRGSSVRRCDMSCTKASDGRRRGFQFRAVHVGLAITGDACAAGVSGHSGASSGSGATYKTTVPPDFWESKWYIEASIKGFSVRHCEMSCTKASDGRRRGSQVRAMQVGSAITGDACAASVAGVSGHSGASSGSGATYKTTIPPDFWESKWYIEASIKGFSVRHCEMSCTKASDGRRRGSQVRAM